MWQGNIISLILTTVVLLIIGAVSYKIYSKQDEKPIVWKVVVAILVGFFSVSITLTFFERPIQIAVIPLGLLILLWILKRRNSWKKYRKFAWLGFSANYLFLASTILGILVHGLFYPEEEIYTYIQDLSDAKIIAIHPSAAKDVTFSEDALELLADFEEHDFYSDAWYRETFTLNDEPRKERFPYLVANTPAKWGSGYTPRIYLEHDGTGLLITTEFRQIYFKSKQSLLNGVNLDE